MKRIGLPVLLLLGGMVPGASAQTESFTADIVGMVQSVARNAPSPFQIGPAPSDGGEPTSRNLDGAPGRFLSYTATAGLPQLTGNDLSNFGFSLYATTVTPDTGGLYDYSGTFRIFAPGYGYTANDGDILELGTFTAEATFTDPDTASVNGLFNADPGFLQPPGYPVPVDFAPGSPAQFLGTFSTDADGVQTLSGRLQTVPGVALGPPAAVPEAGTLPLVTLGVVTLAVVGLRRRLPGAAS